MSQSSQRQIYKIAILSHDEKFYSSLGKIFGIEFEKSYTETSGAAFAFSHFVINNRRLTAQFWLLDSHPQWITIRNLYMRGVSGIILLLNPGKKGAVDLSNRLLREFVSVNRFAVPIVVLGVTEQKKRLQKQINAFATEIERWSGIKTRNVNINDASVEIDEELKLFMTKVRDWQAKNIIYSTLKYYFNLDAILNKSRVITKIAKQLRKIYTARYYELVDDEVLVEIIKGAAIFEGFSINDKEGTVIYRKKISEDPWDIQMLNSNDSIDDLTKPNITRFD